MSIRQASSIIYNGYVETKTRGTQLRTWYRGSDVFHNNPAMEPIKT